MTSSFLFIFLVLGATIFSQCQPITPDEKENICEVIDPFIDITATTPLLINNTQSFSQFECVKNFEITIDSENYLNRYLIFEVFFNSFSLNPKFRPLLLVKNGTAPQVLINSSDKVIIEADSYDKNGFYNRKTYHNIVIQPSGITIGKKLIFSIYYYTDSVADYFSKTTSYEVNVTSTLKFPCPQGCNGNGYCNQGLQRCICNRSYFDNDCSVQAKEILFESNETTVSPQNNAFFFADNLGSDESLKVLFNKSMGYLKFYFLLNQQDNYSLPNPSHHHSLKELHYDENGSYVILTQTFLSTHGGSTLLINVYNNDSREINIIMMSESYDEGVKNRETLMQIMIGVSALLIIVWAIVTLVKYKHRDFDPLPNQDPMNQDEEREVLNNEDLDRYFIKKAHKEHRFTFPQKTCSICLEDFHTDSICRQLYCEHIYHDKCIENWLHKHDTCPNCKTSMTKEAIERYLAEMKPPEMENNESAPDSSDPLKKSEREALDIYEEEKEDRGSLNNISIKLKDNYYERKLSNVNLEENNSRYKKREKRSNSNNKGTLRALDKRKISSHREGSSLQSELIDIEENLGQVLGRMDVSGNIEARMNRDKVKNVGDKNPLNKYKFSPEASPEKESDQMV